MRVISRLRARPSKARPLALAIGVFDGLHLGHQAVILAAVRAAKAQGLVPAVLSFDPAPEAALGLPIPLRLGHPGDQEAVLRELGVELLYRVPFTTVLARLSAEAFVLKVLRRCLRCNVVSVGQGFRFGSGASAGVAELKALGLGVLSAGPKRQAGHLISSTRLRHAVQQGRLAEAAKLLGRPWRLRGTVVRGRGLGSQIGFPTANVASPQQVLPPRGVWAGRCRVLSPKGPGPWNPFAANIGLRPTLGPGLKLSVELHWIGFKGSLRGREVEAEFQKKLRAERRFPSREALSAQIARDVSRARRLSRI